MELEKDSINTIVTGVGGQGNVLLSQIIGQVFINKGYFVTIGETYGASQRGGPVMSHIRISKKRQLSPIIPKGKSNIVIALEPIEALRVIELYGNPNLVSLVNLRPIYPVDVTAGDEIYPDIEDIKKCLKDLSKKAYFIDATEIAIQMGSSILMNMIMIGALLQLKLLSLDFPNVSEVLSKKFNKETLDTNLQAIVAGEKIIKDSLHLYG
jgi:indolepyruvate ferredoxin oxidoreductase beta subunit